MIRFGLTHLSSMGPKVSHLSKTHHPFHLSNKSYRDFFGEDISAIIVGKINFFSTSFFAHTHPSLNLTTQNWARTYKSEADNVYLVKVPKMGDSITEGTISAWKKSIGDYVKVDDVICVIDTDKVSVDIHTDVSGSIVKYAAEEGETVYVGGDLVSIDTFSTEQAKENPSQAIASDNTPISSAVKKKGYTPMISFPDRTLKDQSNKTAKHPSSLSSPNTQLPRVQATLQKVDDSPGVNVSLNISDEEIEIINLGGISNKTENKLGKWKTFTDMV